jgi:glycosyltransferase involved in cell wall biosynthesis
LLSYNRPRMLEHAFRSIVGADEIILVDDGSAAFDVAAWKAEHGIRYGVLATPRSIDRRMTTASLGRLINGALHIAAHQAKLAAVAYLCDDDLFAPDWVETVRRALADPTGPHVCRGRWRSFDDPLDGPPLARPGKTRPAPLDTRRMTTGNFAHRAECYLEGFRWSEETIAVHDDTALWRLNALHRLDQAVDTKALAGYRREHSWNMCRVTSHSEYGIGAYEALARGVLE